MSRRGLATSLGALAALSLTRCYEPADAATTRLRETAIGGRKFTLTAHPRKISVVPGQQIPAWLYGDTPFPVLRLKRGETLDVTLENQLPQHTSIHWHGVRVPNGMDGVPYLTQHPVQPGKRFTYRFTPPDAGTFFFHPHCNTAEQLGRGMIGALIVEDEEDGPFDDDIPLLLKDWRIDTQGKFEPFLTLRGAGRAGSFGKIRTINARCAPHFDVAAGAYLRLRLINADATRICAVAIVGASASIIAIDGNPVAPLPLESWRLGPGMRVDLAVKTPRHGGFHLADYFSSEPATLATFNASMPLALRHTSPVVRRDEKPIPDVSRAWTHTLSLGAGVAPLDVPTFAPIRLPDGTMVDIADSLCLAAQSFWTIDGQAWPMRDHNRLPPPLFSAPRGQTVLLEIENTTSRVHPIHIHGHTMTVLSTTILRRPIHRADTVLVMPNERVKVAFVADNPGNWMVHCHVIEHQETGMMGWFRVS